MLSDISYLLEKQCQWRLRMFFNMSSMVLGDATHTASPPTWQKSCPEHYNYFVMHNLIYTQLPQQGIYPLMEWIITTQLQSYVYFYFKTNTNNCNTDLLLQKFISVEGLDWASCCIFCSFFLEMKADNEYQYIRCFPGSIDSFLYKTLWTNIIALW